MKTNNIFYKQCNLLTQHLPSLFCSDFSYRCNRYKSDICYRSQIPRHNYLILSLVLQYSWMMNCQKKQRYSSSRYRVFSFLPFFLRFLRCQYIYIFHICNIHEHTCKNIILQQLPVFLHLLPAFDKSFLSDDNIPKYKNRLTFQLIQLLFHQSFQKFPERFFDI